VANALRYVIIGFEIGGSAKFGYGLIDTAMIEKESGVVPGRRQSVGDAG